MKFYHCLLLCLSAILFSNCLAQNAKEKSIDKSQSNSTIVENKPKEEAEDFDEFLEKFNNNRVFQLKRIVFPVKVYAPDAQEIGLSQTESVIEKYDWELLDLSYDSTYATRGYDQYLQTVSFANDTANVSLRGIDNGIDANYLFALIDGKWFLVTLYE